MGTFWKILYVCLYSLREFREKIDTTVISVQYKAIASKFSLALRLEIGENRKPDLAPAPSTFHVNWIMCYLCWNCPTSSFLDYWKPHNYICNFTVVVLKQPSSFGVNSLLYKQRQEIHSVVCLCFLCLVLSMHVSKRCTFGELNVQCFLYHRAQYFTSPLPSACS